MRSVCCCAFIGAVGVAAGSSTAAYIADGSAVISTCAYTVLPGGEFTITPVTGFVGLTGLPADLDAVSFQSFCVEVDEHYSPGGTYDMVLNTVAVLGGSGGPFYPLDERVAYLYHHFRYLTLTGYDYSPAGRTTSAGELQAAIWFIQGNQAGGANNAFVALADGAVGSGDWSGLGDVLLVNMYDSNGGLAQDQLTIVPAPSAAALLGLGVVVAGRRRRGRGA